MRIPNPQKTQTIYDACKQHESENETLEKTEILKEDDDLICVRAYYRDDTKPHMVGYKYFEIEKK